MKINRDQIILLFYISALVLFTSIHKPMLLLFALVTLFLVAGRSFFYLFKRTVKSLFISLLVVSLSYLAMGLFKKIDPNFLILLNLRVVLLTFMTFLMLERINLFKALSFSKQLSALVAIAFSQMTIFRRTFSEFKMGYASRTVKPTFSTWLISLKAALLYFLNKTLHTSKEITNGMKSRGFFND
ncbi:hypothetical protein RZR97_08575 [Hydrogenimonas thermophila]|uniref:hypothetical protein n=1 Tax=Hydrogenimonas thermophila TaxID=223786 RepID=UPI0029371663|nr:hypothetical protein [Hydrogenimonas thermophila]WOE69163.1 hypothetical protein RZR91_08600 [Hydrogenimonas thermophila]WOE71673.1 hypothetical protein RZR97_08575 [Hydrogenimonas thermophila]